MEDTVTQPLQMINMKTVDMSVTMSDLHGLKGRIKTFMFSQTQIKISSNPTDFSMTVSTETQPPWTSSLRENSLSDLKQLSAGL